MDGSTFDRLTRTLTIAGSRRGTLGGLLGGALGTLGLLGEERIDEAGAHDLKIKCKKLKGDKKKKCLKKAKKHKAQHAKETPAPIIPAECGTPADCPTPQGLCQIATCIGGRCGVANRAVGDPCDDGLFCNGRETCDGNGNCRVGTPPCDDGIACTDDSCDEETDTCTHTPNDTLCATGNPCVEGQCVPSASNRDQNGCVFTPVAGGTITCGIGACQRTVQQCIDGQEQMCEPGPASAEICNGIDDDCDGLVDEGAICPSGQRCQSGACCKEDGFGTGAACTSNTECCSGNCATHDFGRTCRPEGCLPSGADCQPNCPSACCSVTGSTTTCQ